MTTNDSPTITAATAERLTEWMRRPTHPAVAVATAVAPALLSLIALRVAGPHAAMPIVRAVRVGVIAMWLPMFPGSFSTMSLTRHVAAARRDTGRRGPLVWMTVLRGNNGAAPVVVAAVLGCVTAAALLVATW